MHRFGIDNFEFVKAAKDWKIISISVGVNGVDREALKSIKSLQRHPDYITVDIAHGHSILMCEMLEFLNELGLMSKIIAGNVCTPEGAHQLIDWGADAIKVGIGQGGVCSTKNKTGITYPMYSCVKNISDYLTNHINIPYTPIIADGGVREHGDVVKAIHAGAAMVMAGGLFSRLIDSPAEVIDGHKIYYGSASQYNKGEYRNVEGVKRSVELDPMTYEDKLLEMTQDLQSAVSYCGGSSLYDIREATQLEVTSWES
jgi:GMP reductase